MRYCDSRRQTGYVLSELLIVLGLMALLAASAFVVLERQQKRDKVIRVNQQRLQLQEAIEEVYLYYCGKSITPVLSKTEMLALDEFDEGVFGNPLGTDFEFSFSWLSPPTMRISMELAASNAYLASSLHAHRSELNEDGSMTLYWQPILSNDDALDQYEVYNFAGNYAPDCF